MGLPEAWDLPTEVLDDPIWAMLVLWWLKPLFDRVLLRVLAPAVFGDPPGVARTSRDSTATRMARRCSPKYDATGDAMEDAADEMDAGTPE